MGCDVCEIDQKSPNVVMNDKCWFVIVSYDQLYLGRCLVVLKRHCPSLSDLHEEEVTEWFEIVKKLEYSLSQAFKPKLFNWACLMNDTFKSGKGSNPHVHWHVRPRYSDPVVFSDRVFADPDFAHHYGRDHDIVEPDLIEKVAKTIRHSLAS